MQQEKDKVVYLHIKLDTGEPFYIGKGYLKRAYSKTRSKYWHNIVNKHGFDVIILRDNLTNKESLELEIYWIDRIGRKDLGKGPLINFTDGDGNIGRVCKLETRRKISNSNKGKIAWNKGIPSSEETKKKMFVACKGKNLGKEHSSKVKLKISTSLKGRTLTETHKANLSKAKKGKVSNNKGKTRTPKSIIIVE